ncbi:proteasome subunit beta type 3, putative [Perkinsus marinus ATCC 50983]|uniref:Proteasome subunit beta type 3, putative n=1 Tax=Perkinsus marinus (strain ATCC 50983 / TXsc) TaxID=423536 RepID=C5KWL6_PERM5|nr:proteasome subunit beta type 3, putative [Perkinsus marinus ATCC 50983]EER11091.1 proteasome subunit beta type 3, putative [Perkinsus marinus ATCC 50983]|eukprot:XP_002779296.1 proteasome subunit beta type 3, putative [Perkinsus marinus ATCC 50983]
MNRIFGVGKKKVEAPPAPTGPSLAETSEHLDSRVTLLDKKIKQCDEDLIKYKQQMATRSGAVGAKQRALAVLKRKKMYEAQRDQMMNTQFNVDQAAFTQEQIQTNINVVESMKVANSAMKSQMNDFNIDHVEDVVDDMADIMMDQEEINDILGRSYNLPEGCDDAALEAEFTMLEEEVAMDKENELRAVVQTRASTTTLVAGLSGTISSDVLANYIAGTRQASVCSNSALLNTSNKHSSGNIMEYNGGSVIAMKGEGCVGIACDRRYGVNQLQTVSANMQKVYPMTSRCLVGFQGLATDSQTLSQLLKFRLKLYKLKEDREMPCDVVSHLMATMLYEKRFGPYFCEPVIAGLKNDGEPFISSFDLIGTESTAPDFIVSGTATEQLMGVAESFWREGMGPEELAEVLGQSLLSGIDRDCLSGWGGVVYILTDKELITKTLKGRMD